MIHTTNHGPLILASSFWGSEIEKAGKLFASVNAGAIRLLVPAAMRPDVEIWREARHAVLSRGPWLEHQLAEGVEILWEDCSDNPYAIYLTPASFDMLPAEPPVGQEWIVSVWDLKKNRPHKCLERVCHWRRVPRVPWLKPWEPT